MDKPQPVTGKLIAYRWAFNETGYPVPIEAALRGQRYVCPLCRGQMVARLGDVIQHHYGHELETGCPPTAVTRAALRRWITIQLRDAIVAHQVIRVQCQCWKCHNVHVANVLEGASQAIEAYTWDAQTADAAIVDSAGNVVGVLLIQDEEAPPPGTLEFFAHQEVFVISVPASAVPTGSSLKSLIDQSRLVGGQCPVLQKASNVIQEPEAIRQALRDVVARWPGYFFGPLETVEGLANVVRMNNQALWLPAERWREIIGGTRNPLAPGVQIIVQTWPHADGGVIWLYHATVRDTGAVGVRRYGPGQTPTAYIDARFRHRNTTALDVVRYFVTQSWL